MNLLVFVVLLALAWYSLEQGMTFFAFLIFFAAVLMLYTQRNQSKPAYATHHGNGEQKIIFESGEHPAPQHESTKILVKKWKDDWDGRPNQYLLLHFGIAMNNVARSILYMFGLEKDEKEDDH